LRTIKASAGLNLARDYLPGAITFDPVADKPDAAGGDGAAAASGENPVR
jgi:hypothetical protein